MSSEGGVDFVFTRVRIRFKSGSEICSEITELHPAFEALPSPKNLVNQFPHLYLRSEEMEPRRAYVTLLTRNSYLPAALVLNESFKQAGSKYPLVIMSTPSLPPEAREALTRQGLEIVTVDSLHPTPGTRTLSDLDSRFADTWTKLRYVSIRCALSSGDEPCHFQGIRFGGFRGMAYYDLAGLSTNTIIANCSP